MRHVTRFLTNKEYAETKRDAILLEKPHAWQNAET